MTIAPTSLQLTVAHTRKVSPLVVIAAVVALVFIGTAALVATLYAPPGHDANVITAFVLGTLAPTVVGLLALIRGDHAVQQGEQNAQRLVDTAAKVEEVAHNVNGHLEAHQELAERVTTVAEGIAAAAGVPVQVRSTASRTRSGDGTSTTVTEQIPAGMDAPPLAPDQS